MTTIKVLMSRPANQDLVVSNEPIQVAGTATGKGGLEQIGIDTVTVGFLGGTPVEANLTQVKNPAVPTYTYTASLTAPDAFGPRDIVVTALADDQVTTATTTVTVNVESHVAPPTSLTPQKSLRVSRVNPAPPSSGDWAADIVKANRSETDFSILDFAVWHTLTDEYPICRREWNQVIDLDQDYDRFPVGFSGWLLEPEMSGNDVPFTHPFGNDWECMVALDNEYAGLLAPGNVEPDGAEGGEAVGNAEALGIPEALKKASIAEMGGLLAVETDGGCVPSALYPPFGDLVRPGDRIAVLGRWIVDAGHSVEVKAGDTPQLPQGGKSYRAEVHPPLLMAIGGTRQIGANDVRTRVVLTSRPYLVQQVYTTDTGTIYEDAGSDDGTLIEHLNREIAKLHPNLWHGGIPDSVTIEAHPKIAAKPFAGVHEFHFSVQPPESPGVAGLDFGHAEVSFQLTHRTGVGVQVIGSDEIVLDATGKPTREARVDVHVGLSSAGYDPPFLPPRQEYSPSREQLLSDTSHLISLEQIWSLIYTLNPITFDNLEQALARGIRTDKYDVPDVALLDTSHALPFTGITAIPAGQGVVVDDDQPYPVFGFLDIRWHTPVILGSP